jgi:hypothetical protein
MTALKQNRRNNTLQLLLILGKHANGGRWETTIIADFGSNPNKVFTPETLQNPYSYYAIQHNDA